MKLDGQSRDQGSEKKLTGLGFYADFRFTVCILVICLDHTCLKLSSMWLLLYAYNVQIRDTCLLNDLKFASCEDLC